ncbi:hypothetical protein [Kribbella swartbergensis]
MNNLGAQHRPNIVFNLLGALLIVAGIAVALYGLAAAVQLMTGSDPFGGGGVSRRLSDAVAVTFWGAIVLTIGRYVWRGARRRGARDRFGRLLAIVGYLLLGVGLDRGLEAGVRLARTGSQAAAQAAVVDTLVAIAVWAVPGVVIASIGFKLCDEKALLEASVKAEL